MTSEDSYHDDRYSHRARKRGSTVARRRRHRRETHHGHKTRRASPWSNQRILRLVSLLFVFMLVCYELAAFRNSLLASSATTIHNSHAGSDPVSRLVEPPDLDSHSSNHNASLPFVDGATTAERVTAAVISDHSDLSDHHAAGKKHRPPSPAKPKTLSKFAAAWEMVEKPADADADDEPDEKDEVKTPKQKRRREKVGKPPSPGVANPPKPRKTTRAQKPDSGDIEPPKVNSIGKVGEGGSEPGAGENFWQWFQDTKGDENGKVGKSLKCPKDYKRLCEMFYKYLRKYKIRLVFDVSCSKNTEWMPDVIQKIGNELWGFKYFCSLPDRNDMSHTKESFAGIPFVEYNTNDWWKTGFPSETELLFAWDVLPHIAYGRVWNFFVHAKKQDLKYVLVDNYPGILNDPSPKRSYLNIRKHPFRFPAAKEVVQNVTEPGETAKRQLLFYEGASLPDNLL